MRTTALAAFLAGMSLLSSLPALAATKAVEFKSIAEYQKFLSANPNVKVIAVTPIYTYAFTDGSGIELQELLITIDQ